MTTDDDTREQTRPDQASSNLKHDPSPPGNAEKDPSDWVSGGDPMTAAQASYLKTLSEQARDPQAFDPDLTKAEASRRIDALRAKIQKASDPPHTA
jgi:hypothetical protein